MDRRNLRASTRVQITFEMDVFDYPYRDPSSWNWSQILEDDGTDVPDWGTLTVTKLDKEEDQNG